MFFVMAKYKQYKQYPYQGEKGAHSISKVIAKEWGQMTDELKHPFNQLRDRDKVRY